MCKLVLTLIDIPVSANLKFIPQQVYSNIKGALLHNRALLLTFIEQFLFNHSWINPMWVNNNRVIAHILSYV
jgi:hypothetical protein